MHFYTLIKVNLQIKTALLLALFLLKGHFCWTQNVLEQKSFDFLSNYLDHHKSADTLYFEYAKAYENKAFKAHDLEKLFYIKSKYIVHGNAFSDKLAHAQQLLNLAKQQNNTRYVGLANNLLSLVYFMERNLEQALHYELLAEELLSQTNDLYNLNKSRFGIGSMYYFLGDYEKALTFFNQTAGYYKSQDSYNDLNGYLSSLRYIGKCYFALKKYKEIDEVLEIASENANHLKTQHRELNDAYFSLLKGQKLWAQKQHAVSLTCLQKAVPVIINNDDFANEHLAYLYMGKNLWALNEKEAAVEQFKKIDDLFTTKQYSDLNLLEAYTYLITFYKTDNNLSQQLFYTERLLEVTNELQTKNKGLSSVLHSKYETKKLEANRKELQTKLNTQKQKGYLLYGFALSLAIGFIGYIIYNRKKQKALRSKYEYFAQKQLLMELNVRPVVISNTAEDQQAEKIVVEEKTEEQINKPEQKADKKVLAEDKVQEIIEKLTQFEENSGFLNPNITLGSLAKDFDTNAKYLSEVINSTKNENFSSYVNKLRIKYAVLQLHEKKSYRKLTINALADKFGFNNARSFSDAFFKVTGLKPSYYISQLKKDEKMAS